MKGSEWGLGNGRTKNSSFPNTFIPDECDNSDTRKLRNTVAMTYKETSTASII